MPGDEYDEIRAVLETKKRELSERLARITANVRRGFQADSEERAKEMEDSEVVDALGNEAREELARISLALSRLDAGDYGLCTQCGEPIARKRLAVYPFASDCIDCARDDEMRESRPV